MQLGLALFCGLAGSKMASAIPATTDIYYHEQTHLPEAMWTFSDKGVTIVSIDGQKELTRHSAADLNCGEACFYFNVVTDGRKYVWGNALHSSLHRVDVFSLETGDYLGGVATCSTPLDMDYIPNREELWIRCAGDDENTTTATGHLAVIPTNAMGVTSDHVRLSDVRNYGYAVFHSSLGNYGYATDNTENTLWKVDLAYRQVVANFTLKKAHSTYDATYSPLNKHIYLRSRVCCTCGFEGADAATCGRSPGMPGQNIQTGPSAGRTDLNGTCGADCEGSLADTIGVMEFDTVSETFVANHQPLEGFGAKPQASPDGRYIVLSPNDGGKNVRVLQAGENGQPATVAFDIPLDFENVPPGTEAVSDFAFVEWKNRSILALASGYDNHLALADLSNNPPTVTKVLLSSSASPTGGSSGRMVEWAYGTEYLWVDGSSNEEVYVLKLDEKGGASVHHTIANAPTNKMIYVENFAERAVENLMADYMATALTKDESSASNTAASSKSDDLDDSDLLLQKMEQAGLVVREEEQVSVVAIIALVIGCLSLSIHVIFIVNYFFSSSKTGVLSNKQKDSNKMEEDDDDEQDKTSNIPDDSKTLGSKQVA